jgi:hypothetical protein
MYSNSNKNSLHCKVYYLFDTNHFFFRLKKKTAITNIPTNPKITGKMSASQLPPNKNTPITIKNIPINSTIFWSIKLHILISSYTLYRLSLKRLYLNQKRREFVFISKIKFIKKIKICFFSFPGSTSITQRTLQ